MDVKQDRLLYQEHMDRLAQRKQGLIHSPEQMVLLQLKEAQAADWQKVVSTLSPFMKEQRVIRLQSALRRRRSRLHVVLENIADPHNGASVLRAAEACGVQHVHVIESVCEFHMPAVASRSASFSSNEALDASRWLSIHKYRSTQDCIDSLTRMGLLVRSTICFVAPAPFSDEAVRVCALRCSPRIAPPTKRMTWKQTLDYKPMWS